MREKPFRWRCYWCGKFIAFTAARYEWTPFGGALDVDPPGEEQAHVDCFKANLPIPRQWIGPTLHEAVAA